MNDAGLTGLTILVIEDEVLLRKQTVAFLERAGAEVSGVSTLAESRRLIENTQFDFVLIDVNLPDGRGTDLLKERMLSANVCTLVMTAQGGVAGAVEAMKLGATDYLVKPFDLAELPLAINRARHARQLARVEEHRRVEELPGGEFFFGKSLAALEIQLKKILAADLRMEQELPPVLIQGETGTGKTTIARWLHQQGPQASQPLVEVNCSALPETLAESELFGHERGAFTDARTARMGLFEAATGGTLFLDELPSLSLTLQTKILSTIEDHRIRRLGGNKPIKVNARLIGATNRDLKELVAAGQFREDLYHRMDLYRIYIPPLRERNEDIITLAELLKSRLCRRHRLPQKEITDLGRNRLLAYSWPGNVRELSHELERAIVFEDSPKLDFEHLQRAPLATVAGAKADDLDWFNSKFVFPEQGFSLKDAINRLIQHALNQANGNVSASARLLGVSRDYVRYRFDERKPE